MLACFHHEPLPGRVVFGTGSLARLEDEVRRMGCTRVLVLSTPGRREQAERVARQLGPLSTGIFAGAVMHVPVEAARTGAQEAAQRRADGCVAIGGGSAVGLGKAIAREIGLPLLAVPTTYSGSEMTPVWGLTEGGLKRTGRDLRVLPRCVIYDPDLVRTLPPAIAGPSGMNALAHCVEALYAEDANPVISLLAEEGIRVLARSLPSVVHGPGDVGAHSEALYGAWLAGTSLAHAGVALHHKLCHALGGSFDLPHAAVHTIVLPHAVAYNRQAAPEAMERIAGALGVCDAAGGLYDLAKRLGARLALREIGMREADLDRAVEIAMQNPYFNPAPISRPGLRALLQNAYEGARPEP